LKQIFLLKIMPCLEPKSEPDSAGRPQDVLPSASVDQAHQSSEILDLFSQNRMNPNAEDASAIRTLNEAVVRSRTAFSIPYFRGSRPHDLNDSVLLLGTQTTHPPVPVRCRHCNSNTYAAVLHAKKSRWKVAFWIFCTLTLAICLCSEKLHKPVYVCMTCSNRVEAEARLSSI